MVRIAFDSEIIKKLEFTSSSLRIKAKDVPEIIDQLCDKALELSTILTTISKNTAKHTFKKLLNQLYYWEKKATKKEKVIFFIFKESINSRIIFLKSIIKRLSWSKPCTTQEAHNLIKQLEKQGLIFILKSCPNCNTPLRFVSNKCEKCDYIVFSQEFDYKDKRLRPRYAIKITDEGIAFVKELIIEYLHIQSFFITWYKHESLNEKKDRK